MYFYFLTSVIFWLQFKQKTSAFISKTSISGNMYINENEKGYTWYIIVHKYLHIYIFT